MVSYQNHLGTVSISDAYFVKLIGEAVSSCYGVAHMVPKGKQMLRNLITRGKKSYTDTGIVVRGNEKAVTVDLHITVIFGLNIAAISRSIINKVTYTVQEATGIKVKKVLVHVDRMIAE